MINSGVENYMTAITKKYSELPPKNDELTPINTDPKLFPNHPANKKGEKKKPIVSNLEIRPTTNDLLRQVMRGSGKGEKKEKEYKPCEKLLIKLKREHKKYLT